MDMNDKHGRMIERIYNELVGDEYTEGLIPKVERMNEKLKNHSILFRIAIGVFVVLAAIIAAIANAIRII